MNLSRTSVVPCAAKEQVSVYLLLRSSVKAVDIVLEWLLCNCTLFCGEVLITFCFQAGVPVFLEEPEAIGTTYDPYDLIKQLSSIGNINSSSEDRDNFRELYALTSSPSSEILECAPSSQSSSSCSSRSFSPHTPPGSPPSSPSSPPHRMDTTPSLYDHERSGPGQPVRCNSVLEHTDALPLPPASPPTPRCLPGRAQCCYVPTSSVSYIICFNIV